MNFEPDKSVEEYKLFDLITYSPDYGKVYFPDKYMLAGHTPTSLIAGNPNSDCIYRDNRHIANDCAAASGGWIGAFCLDTGEEFYSKEKGREPSPFNRCENEKSFSFRKQYARICKNLHLAFYIMGVVRHIEKNERRENMLEESIEIRSLLDDAAAVQSNPLLYDFKREIIHFQKGDDAIDRFMKYKAIGCKEAGNHECDFAFEEIEQIYHEYESQIRVPKGEADSAELLLSIMKHLYSDEVMKCCPSCDTFNSAMTTLSKINFSGFSTKSARQIVKLYAKDRNSFKKTLEETIPFFDVAYTLGNFIPVPSGFNSQKGISKLTKDYSDLTLKIIYEYYNSKDDSILEKFLTGKYLQAAKTWLDIFGTWEKFVEKNYLQDFVDADNILLELWDGHFSGNVLPTHEEALAYFRNAAKRIALRGERMLKGLGREQ